MTCLGVMAVEEHLLLLLLLLLIERVIGVILAEMMGVIRIKIELRVVMRTGRGGH